MQVGDRVVNKVSGKHGTVEMIVRPIQIGNKPKIMLRVDNGGGNYEQDYPHNFVLEKDWEQPVVKTWEDEGIKEGADADKLTPMPETDSEQCETPIPTEPNKKSSKKKKEADAEAVIDDIVNAAE